MVAVLATGRLGVAVIVAGRLGAAGELEAVVVVVVVVIGHVNAVVTSLVDAKNLMSSFLALLCFIWDLLEFILLHLVQVVFLQNWVETT